jgi:hypothetical protein
MIDFLAHLIQSHVPLRIRGFARRDLQKAIAQASPIETQHPSLRNPRLA